MSLLLIVALVFLFHPPLNGIGWQPLPSLRRWPGREQDRAHDSKRTSLRKPKTISRENNVRCKPMGLAIKSAAQTFFQLLKLYFAYSTCCYKVTIFELKPKTPALHTLHLYYKVAIFQPELENCTSRTRLALHSCDCPAGAGSLYFAY